MMGSEPVLKEPFADIPRTSEASQAAGAEGRSAVHFEFIDLGLSIRQQSRGLLEVKWYSGDCSSPMRILVGR